MTSPEPVPDIVGAASTEVAADSVVQAVIPICNELLAPTAQTSDRDGVPRSHIDALAEVGVLGANFPESIGGGGRPLAVTHEIMELVSGACGTTWFCYAQHMSPTGILASSGNLELRERLLGDLTSGRKLGATAIAHLRRPKQAFFATEVQGGWRLDGKLDWITSWPIADVAVIQAAVVDEQGNPVDQIVSSFIEVPKPDPSRAPGLSAGPKLELAAMGGTHTWPVRFGGYRVADADVATLETKDEWNVANSRFSADANPASFGIARASINDMIALGERTGQTSVVATANALTEELRETRSRSYELAEAARTDPAISDATEAERIELRAAALDLTIRSANALIASSGGGSMSLYASPQRRAREAIFLLVQGQTGQLRNATLRRSTRAASIDS